jgi:hypothetical protein
MEPTRATLRRHSCTLLTQRPLPVMEAGGVDNGTPGTFTVQTVDGTQQVVTTTIDGANYTPVALTSGDVIDLSALLDANFGASSNIADFVRVTQTGSNVTVQVDPDGAAGGANFSDVRNSQWLRNGQSRSGYRVLCGCQPYADGVSRRNSAATRRSACASAAVFFWSIA